MTLHPSTTEAIQSAGDEFREQVLTSISVALLRRRISGRGLSRLVAENSHGWWSKRYNGELALTVADLGAIAEATGIPVAELLGVQPTGLTHPIARDVEEILTDTTMPRKHKDDFLGLLGHAVAMFYAAAARRSAPARGRR